MASNHAAWSLVPSGLFGLALVAQVMPWTVLLAWAAAALEVVGVVCVVVDLARTRREAEAFFRRDVVLVAGTARIRSRANAVLTSSGTPTTAQRLQALEATVATLRDEIYAESDYLQKTFQEDLASARNAITTEHREQWQKLEHLLRGQTLGALNLRLTGVGFVLGGVVLGAVANTATSMS